MPSRRTPRRSGALRLAAALTSLLALLAPSPPLAAQTGAVATVETEENFRAEPNGVLLGRLLPGTTLLVEAQEGRWTRAELEGWVWTPSLQSTDRLGLDLVVTAEGGENLRAEPQGAVLAELEQGTLLEEVERVTGWIRVRRTGWVWTPSVSVEDLAPGDRGAAPGDAERVATERPSPAADSVPSGEAAGAGRGVLRAPADGLPILGAPGGDTLARARAGAEVQVLGREGGWARVRVEGWSWVPGGGDGTARAGGVVEATPREVRAEPERFAGRVVTWELQFVSVERAESVRTDFYEGEPFLLTRPPGGEGVFVYVAVPEDRLDEVGGLAPLERISVTGRIRVGASVLTGSPILDLMELRRDR